MTEVNNLLIEKALIKTKGNSFLFKSNDQNVATGRCSRA